MDSIPGLGRPHMATKPLGLKYQAYALEHRSHNYQHQQALEPRSHNYQHQQALDPRSTTKEVPAMRSLQLQWRVVPTQHNREKPTQRRPSTAKNKRIKENKNKNFSSGYS